MTVQSFEDLTAIQPSESSEMLFELLSAAETQNSVIYAVDSKLRLIYCNPHWDLFARENHGARLIRPEPYGSWLMDAISDPLRPFYIRAFEDARRLAEPWEHDYECSSPEEYRRFRMRILPVPDGTFVVVNTLIEERPHDRVARQPDRSRYCQHEGMITMCCHCRRTVRADEPKTWDWVPDYLENSPREISHGLCDLCLAYFYPASSLRDLC